MVLDRRLVGYWSDDVLYQGAMEAADIAFVADGSGWTYWSRIGEVFAVERFAWHSSGRDRLRLRLHHRLSGTWTVRGGHVEHHVEREDRCDTTLAFTYTIGSGCDAIGGRVTLLELDRPISVGMIGERFAFKRGQVDGEDDPTC